MRKSEAPKWFKALKGNLLFPDPGHDQEQQSKEMISRTLIVVKTRWLVLLLLSIYGLYAGGFFYFSKYGFFLSDTQLYLLLAAVAAVVIYNSFLEHFYAKITNFRKINILQISLDILFVTILIQSSGGAASWFWPVYLVVTIEASFLLERRSDVWLIGAGGTLLYIGGLIMNYSGIVPHVTMPFVDDDLYFDLLYLVLMAFWVAILNSTVAIISTYLMSVIRSEAEALRESEEQLGDFLDSANDLIFSITPEGKFLYVNNAWQETMGYSLGDLGPRTFFDLLHKSTKENFIQEIKRVMSSERGEAIDKKLVARNGRVISIEGNLTCGEKEDSSTIWGICRDVTERQQAQEQLYHLAHHDALTGLPNRVLLLDRLNHAKALANRLKYFVAILFIDLDRFKIINDTLGHEIGDQLLQSASKRLLGCVREVDTVARIGGDEFVTVLVNLANEKDAEMIAQKITKTLAQPFYIKNHELFVTSSIGICIYPADSDDTEALIKKADIAMYCAKGHGRNNFQFYNPTMDENAAKLLALATSMRKALENEEFTLFYQPKVDIFTGRITALEALLRWDHPEMGRLSPAEFIPLAEETGLILPLGEWVLRTACRQNKKWQDEGLHPIRVAVNLSGYQLQHKNIVDLVKSVLRETGLTPDYLELEVTETVIMQNPDFAVSILGEFRELGIHISIDDFGTGYSSLAHLKRFSVNTLKIDKSFVQDVEINSTDAAIATAIIAMGNSLNLKVIAEGVETEGQLNFLRENQCDEMQGYFFSRPLPASDVADFLRESTANAWLQGMEPTSVKADPSFCDPHNPR